MNLFFFTTLFVLIVSCNDAYKILLVFNFPGRSLSHLARGFVKHLHNAGHEITYVTAFPLKNAPVENFREIDVSKSVEHTFSEEILNVTSILDKHDTSYITDVKGLMELSLEVADAAFQDINFMRLLRNPTEKFDVVIADLIEANVYAGLSVLYDCPMIWSFSMGTQWSVVKLIDEATNPAYVVDYLSLNLPPLTFAQRVEELWTQIRGNYLKEFIIRPKEEALYKKIFI
ncbi:uncharacterized protein LOC113238983 isoform X2 [Hyposmocoma kahamanoa]|uniref:uncharacterized protein LOC113238983 isoform X2 n=1 Tax=Hyposmocoma kahamanoa TaxID=1477025 RepID=UPI000E6DA4DB|nr:uncharacterized protein LOC113238983 isoform X2 [Hyposmocoma kahamanoa]